MTNSSPAGSRLKKLSNQAVKIERTHLKASIFINLSTIRKMSALRNGRSRLQIDSVRAFILCPTWVSIFFYHKECHDFYDNPAHTVESDIVCKADIF